MKASASNAKLNMSKMREFDTMSQASKKSLTKSELSKFFADGKKKASENVADRLSQMSYKSKLKNNLASKAKEAPKAEDIPEYPEVMEYKDEEDPMHKGDDVSVATEAVEGLSVAPTEMLANEYKRLVDQYEQE